MKKTFRLLLVVAAISVLGFGCARPRPRIVQAPPTTTVATTNTNQVTQPPAGQFVGERQYAFIKLDGGQATVKRDGAQADAQDNQAVYGGDEIDVTKGTVSLIYQDSGESQLSAGAKVVVLPADADSKDGEIAQEIQLIAGNIWTRFERLLGPTEQFSVVSNGVVATVRGTAFGVENDGTNVDIQVADHLVEVTADSDATQVPVKLVAGQGLKLKAAAAALTLRSSSRPQIVRQLALTEKSRAGFAFGSRKLQLERLRKPLKPFYWNVKSEIPVLYRPRVEVLRQRTLERLRLLQFTAPTTTPVINTKAQLFLNGRPL